MATTQTPGLGRILGAADEQLVAEVRSVLADLRSALARLDVDAADQGTFERSVRALDELFLLVVVGEFNAGKSAFINALVGMGVAEEGVTPTTSRVGVIGWGEQVARRAEGPLDTITAPAELLRQVRIVDTPGTNAVIREHEELTREFVPRSDLVLFVTSADRPFTESERAFLEAIRQWGKKIVVVLNKKDILQSFGDLTRVMEFIVEQGRTLLGVNLQVYPISAREAVRGRRDGDAEAVERSGLFALEDYLRDTLDDRERLRLKLLNPIGVGQRLLDVHLQRSQGRLDLLAGDISVVEAVDGQLALFAEDLTRDFRFRLADVDNLLNDFERRGREFYARTMRIGRLFDLLNEQRMKREFEKDVVADLPREVDSRVDAIIEWVVGRQLDEWKSISDKLAGRQAAHAGKMIGTVEGPFERDRARLLDEVRRSAQRAVETYDVSTEAARMADSVRTAVASTALVQVSAFSLGAVLTAIATTTQADVTGILAAGTVSIMGLLIIPARRRKAEAELGDKVAALRTQLMDALTTAFAGEQEKSLQAMREALGPYTRFVRYERERLDALRGELSRLRGELTRLRADVERL
jgi:small GTP-binding protein